MTFSNAQSLRTPRRPAIFRACGLGLAFALTAFTANAVAATQGAPAATATVPAKASVSRIDFKRGDAGAGRLILRFDGEGVAPDLRSQSGSVVVDVANASLPAELQRPLDVTDFATPVQRIDAKPYGGGTQLVLSTRGEVESLAYQSGNEYVVEIAPRIAEAAVGAVSGSGLANAQAKLAAKPYSGRPVTFNFQDVPVRTVLQLIAEESNLNIVASDTVQGNVTLRLVNVPWDQALDIVLRAKGLDKRRDGNVVWVAPQPELAAFEKAKEDARIDLENRVDLITDYIQVNYHSAASIFKALTEAKGIGGSGGQGAGNQNENGFLSPRGRIVADERTNTLMISDIPKKVAQMRELIGVIDRPVDQVLIEGRIVIATDSFARELGARFGVSGSRDNAYFSGNLGSNEATRNTEVATNTANANAMRNWAIERAAALEAGTPVPPLPVLAASSITRGLNVNLPVAATSNPAGLALSILNAGYLLDIELTAMQEEQRGEVISNPRVVTSNQREAVIRQGREVGYVTMTGGVGAVATPNVQFKDVLLELKVVPTITDDNRVFLDVNVKKDEVLRYLDTSIGQVPEIAKREVNTAVLVDDGQTVVIGGVYEFTDSNSVSKVPFLGDVPFLGALFKKKGRNKQKAELLIFLTPKVMRVEKRT
ncbi:type IV pilus secretin PilQ [Pseudoxanthomonas broegbernensis]|uniref:Type IV pilus secretin PilQ n=1 Tax=Pseudoxanthomonas broegbernensis TaxID=83619 RepID=A0A7V8GMK1_9GAMM|nr:type IV pilus secretin PilQ family protein [Pseudoxanthomonas broegbernensis]KAF1686463.1 type IV pilus secretin PilQ [Pseudoxanthomonas broegbernensis]MBB6064281.1 type IV pilus assembly protein PilQ [Pseudoxanthomonas broegbernensis]